MKVIRLFEEPKVRYASYNSLKFFQMRNYHHVGIPLDRSSSHLFAARKLTLLRRKNLPLNFKLCYAFKLVYDSINELLTTNEQCVVMVTLPNAKQLMLC